MLELAILGLLHEAPVHGYELRKQLGLRLGGFRVVLLRLAVPRAAPADPGRPDRRGHRGDRRTGSVVPARAGGSTASPPRARSASPSCSPTRARSRWDDDGFGVHLAFFSRTPAETRMRILEGRRRAVEERREGLRAALARAGEQIDRYTRELHQLGLDTSEREVRWLNELIAAGASGARQAGRTEPTQRTPGEQ